MGVMITPLSAAWAWSPQRGLRAGENRARWGEARDDVGPGALAVHQRAAEDGFLAATVLPILTYGLGTLTLLKVELEALAVTWTAQSPFAMLL